MFENHKKRDLKVGKRKEQEFGSLFEGSTYSTDEEDMKEHWDVEITYEKTRLKVDVKGIKKIQKVLNENYHYIELRNVRGDKGWLYGDADAFAFETEDYWILVPKGKLQEFIAVKCRDKQEVTDLNDALYKFITRKNRKDLITLVKTIDLMYIAVEIIAKNEIEKSKQSK